MKKICKYSVLVVFTIFVFFGVVALQPSQKVYAGEFDNPVTFYNTYGVHNQTVFHDNYFYFGAKSKGATNGIRYRTVGYKIKVTTPSGYYAEVAMADVGGPVGAVPSVVYDGYHYSLKYFSLQSLKDLLKIKNIAAYNDFCTYGGNIVIDSYLIVVYYGTPRGGMNPDGTIVPTVYDTIAGISGAQSWSPGTDFSSLFNRQVTYKSAMVSPQTVYYYTQNADGNYSGPFLLINNQNYLIGATLFWQRPADTVYKYSSISYVVTNWNPGYAVYINRQSYTQRTFVAYQDADGNYGNWILADTKSPLYGSTYAYTFAGDTMNGPISVNPYTVVEPKDNYLKIPRLVGKLTTPQLTVQNPTDPGVYYNDGIYYLKADETTKIKLLADAKLNPVNRSRIDWVSLSNETKDFRLSVPSEDIKTNSFLPGKVLTSNNFDNSSILYPKDNWTMQSYDNSKFQFTQDFVINENEKKTLTIKDHASCIDCTEAIHQIESTGNTLSIYGDKELPVAKLSMEFLFWDINLKIDNLNTRWINSDSITLNISDTISGIKSYELSKDGVVVSTNTYPTRTTQTNFNFSTEEGESQYKLDLMDNVGNESTYNFRLHVDKTKPSITDTDTAFGVTNVKATNGPWNVTNVDATWDYNWTKEKLLSFVAEDNSGIKDLDIYNYGTDETYTTIKSQQNFTKDTPFETILKSIVFKDETAMLNGKNHLKIVVKDKAGNQTVVKLVVRIDNRMSTISDFYANRVNLEDYTIEELDTMFSNGGPSAFQTNVQFQINENFSTDDTSGIQKVEVLCKDPTTGTVLKTYDVTGFITSAIETKESASGISLFTPLTRNLSGSYHVGINTLEDLPTFSTLNISIQTTDYAGNVATSEDQTIANYAIKSVIYSTNSKKEKTYNLPVNDGKSNVAYFKTGEVGYIEVWTVGYVDKLELDFSNQNVGQVANTAIANKQLLPKYILGVKNAGMANKRYVTTVKDFKVTSSVPDVNGVPFLSHIKYTPDEVNQSVGDFGINGWAEKGTMIRIPPSLTLTPKTKMIDGKEVGIKDKDGNQLYLWKNCIASVYAFKNNVEGPIPSSCQYTIWDESGDDIHYRVIHQMLKK